LYIGFPLDLDMPRQLPGKTRRNYFWWKVHILCLMIRTNWSRTVIATLSVGLGPDDVGIDQATD